MQKQQGLFRNADMLIPDMDCYFVVFRIIPFHPSKKCRHLSRFAWLLVLPSQISNLNTAMTVLISSPTKKNKSILK